MDVRGAASWEAASGVGDGPLAEIRLGRQPPLGLADQRPAVERETNPGVLLGVLLPHSRPRPRRSIR